MLLIISNNSPVSAKWPKWLVPICPSRPSFVLKYGVAIIPELLSSTSNRSYLLLKSSENLRTEAKLVRSSRITSTSPSICPRLFFASSPFFRERQVRITSAPFRANFFTDSYPNPLFPPVTMITFPVRSGIFFAVHTVAITGQYSILITNIINNILVKTMHYLIFWFWYGVVLIIFKQKMVSRLQITWYRALIWKIKTLSTSIT